MKIKVTLLIIATGGLLGCLDSPEKAILGRWKNTEADSRFVTFCPNNDVIFEGTVIHSSSAGGGCDFSIGPPETGTWKIVTSPKKQMIVNLPDGDVITNSFSIENNILTVTVTVPDDRTFVYERVK